jgi:hypothetical protein
MARKKKKAKPSVIPALTIQQPYIWTVIEGLVTAERRTGSIDHRGPMALISGRRYHDLPNRVKRYRDDFPDCPEPEDLPCGVIIGVIDLVDIWETDEPGMRFVWELRKPRKLKKPVEHTGSGTVVEIDAKLVGKLI